ncbi:ubiquinol-cytochrome-c reductase complex assembly factor 1 [Trichonephila inaurata madagascariensis]|uniref:Ubiquinol-cytochrome-c reductase complex assembly factor 1 n=1 Tax=Trichonephila inaurata madagascariensis TaxID=2747483 RepID=A0A8X6Y6Y7_9ARAC|nr:ubiquinol-cytochrome-c reductase complex assembly factor 1 [Trichonephila inaurata madagascariensis]
MSFFKKTCNISNKLFSLNAPHDGHHTQQLVLKDPLLGCYRDKKCVCVFIVSQCEKLSTSAVVNSSGVSRLVNLKKKVFDVFSASTKIKLGAVVAYEKCADSLDYNEFFSYFKLPDTFQSWFLTMQLHVWMCSAAIISEKNGKVFRNRLIDSMWNDVELRLNELKEIRSSARKEYLVNMAEQFQAAMISYDEGLHSHDVVLAAAAWRTIYGFRPVDPRVLEALVLYIRKQGKMKTIFKLADKVAAFKAKLELWGCRMNRGIFDMFQALAGILGETEPGHSFSQKKPEKNIPLKIAREKDPLYKPTPVSKRSLRQKTFKEDEMDTNASLSDTENVTDLTSEEYESLLQADFKQVAANPLTGTLLPPSPKK